MQNVHLEVIRNFEGFSERSSWDYKQITNGYGTRARYAGEVIDRAEADRRFKAEIETAQAAVTRFAPGLDDGTTAALTSLTFNAGTGWMHSGLGAAVKAGDLDQAREIFKQYTLAGGQSLPGLVARREAEAQWFGGGDTGPGVNSATATPAATAAPQASTGKLQMAVNGPIGGESTDPEPMPGVFKTAAGSAHGSSWPAGRPEHPLGLTYDKLCLDLLLARLERPEAEA